MKFGKLLNDKKVLTWSFYYFDYNGIKKQIARKATSTAELHQREQNFAEVLERELTKINSFHSLKASELLHALKSIKRSIKQQNADGEEENNNPNSDWMQEIIAQLENVNNEMVSFDEYKTINVCAFIKCLKKHDKHQTNQLKGFWAIRLQKEAFVANHPAILDKILLKLSACWQLVNMTKMDKNANKEKKSEAVFERSTTKYWVPADSVLHVKSEVLKHLPISSFNGKSSSLVTSVYYDSEDLTLYHDRLRREEGSIIIRMRTYNEAPHSTVYVERKVHHDSWVNQKSVKSRFPIKEKNLMKYLTGKISMTDKLDKMKERGQINQKEYDATTVLASEIQDVVLKKHLQPTMTSRYERTAFQLEGDGTVRVSLDSKLDLIQEFGYRDGRWGRDLSNEAYILDSEICHFPHAVLEIKLSLESGEKKPQWVEDLLAKEYIISGGKFSKFIHGCAVLLPKKVSLLPAWFPLLEQTSDFRADDRILKKTMSGRTASMKFPVIQHIVSDIKIDVSQETARNTKKNAQESKDKDIELVTKGENGFKSSNNSGKDKKNPGFFAALPFMKKSNKKKVQPNIKIEPKTFFANERTFIQWMSFLIIIQALGFSLVGLGLDPLVRYGGLVFVIISMVFMVYAVALFLIRRHKISRRERGPYDERLGPICIVTLLVIGLIVTTTLRFTNYGIPCKGYPLLAQSFYRYNPSEALWDYDREELVTVGPDIVTFIKPGESRTTDITVAGDLEAVTSIESRPGILYVGLEFPPTIHVLDIASKTVIRSIPLNIVSVPPVSAATGMEGLAFVPINSHPHGGVFWAGNQADGRVYVFDIDLDDPNSEAVLVETFAPIPTLSAISALYYQRENGLVWGILARRWLFSMNPADKTVLNTWPLGVGNPEGIAMVGSGPNYQSYLACDQCQEIWRFKFSDDIGFHSGNCGTMPALIETTTTTDGTQNSGTTTA